MPRLLFQLHRQAADHDVPERGFLRVHEHHVPDVLRQPEHRAAGRRSQLYRLSGAQRDRGGDRQRRGRRGEKVRGTVRRVRVPGPGPSAEREQPAGRQVARVRLRQPRPVDETVHGRAIGMAPGQSQRPARVRRDCARVPAERVDVLPAAATAAITRE